MLQGYGSTILEGAWLTVSLALLSMAVAIALGLLGAAFRLSPVRWLALMGETYATVIRGIPELVLILLIFFGGQDLVNRIAPLLGYEDYIDINPFVAGVGTLGFIYGAYLSETFRGAFMAIPKGQGEAGMAYGMSPLRVFFRILVPQMIRLAIPGLTNNWLVLVKATALISLVGLQDMMARAKSAGDATREPFTYILLAAAVYLVITSVSLLVLRYLERRYSVGVKAAEI
ncbi:MULTISPECIES: ABC transporter permease [Pseudomonas]|uniref:Histidine/lysine/arginine/ornithine transporter subunit membrane component of ABC superfamily n=2 Tax=Ectopseudomonas TaxID=3236654 RepID=A0A653B9K2_ECTOL|nr:MULTISPECIES: ABC transporter permease [Pseudomonas]MBL36001.1 ABC transporter [Oceanospirillaceae bacterium]CAE6911767.1 lysine/arginine/ornithine ABC transporter/histidine ABC transporter, membrane subunit HisQ [Pseudomonas oleovorans]QFT21610.1 Histidine transport system permease protein HisQ [Pseudomonas sp. THAF187a]QFT41797.1 Histidine transport system permease protein HisQ [Pseudomonas sp. THAF42]QTS88210.1 ABC transporter permease [Pseudomonas khazarica]|tara:strand:+ start:2513 stop:3202 length:690 start_codon:yes stop_codon:yes gene_type:complete